VRSALQHAASIGGLMLTTEAMVAEWVEKKPNGDGSSTSETRYPDH
jgi:chaperonin GroEL (HSP60 family)